MPVGDIRPCIACRSAMKVPGSEYCERHQPTYHVPWPGTQVIEPEKTRPTWDEVWLQCAQVMASRSRCSRAQVGAVIVASDQTVISMSYNGPPRGFQTTDGDCREWCPRAMGGGDLSPTYDDCPSVHAEANAIARADHSRMQGATLYVSTSCCKGCAKMLANSGIARVVFNNEAGRDYRRPEETIKFLRECGIEVDVV